MSTIRDTAAGRGIRARVLAYFFLAGSGLGFLLLETIGEGVETADQANRLRDLGCDHARGFHFGRPAPATETGKLLAAAVFGELLV